jgi:hypothetical protein
MNVIRMLNMALSFLLELSALAAFGLWGYTTGGETPLRYILGIGAFVLGAVVWGIWGAPKSKNHLTGWAYLVFSLAFFLLAAVLLFVIGLKVPAIVLAVISIINRALVYTGEVVM